MLNSKFSSHPNFRSIIFSRTIHSNRLRGTSIGLRIAAEFWHEPTPGGIYVGPETQYFGSQGYRSLRVGAHITSMKAEDTK